MKYLLHLQEICSHMHFSTEHEHYLYYLTSRAQLIKYSYVETTNTFIVNSMSVGRHNYVYLFRTFHFMHLAHAPGSHLAPVHTSRHLAT